MKLGRDATIARNGEMHSLWEYGGNGVGASGSALWAVAMGGPIDEDITTAVAATPESGVIALLQHNGEATFGKGQANETFLPAAHPHIQLLSAGRYNASGSLIWARRLAVNMDLQRDLLSTNLLYTSDDGLIIAGAFEGTVTIGPDSPNSLMLNAALGGLNGFVARFAADGEVRWAHQTSGSGSSRVVSVVQLSDDRIAIAGLGTGDLIFDQGGPAEQILPEGETRNSAFVAWYSSDGVFESAAQINGYPDYKMKLAAGENGSTLLAMGGTDGPVDISSNGSVASTDTSGVFLCEFATDGSINDLTMVAEGQLIELGGMVRGANGNFFMTGSIRSSAVFAPGRSSEIEVQGSNGGIFVLQLDSNLDVSWIRNFGGGMGFAIATDPAIAGGAIVGGYIAGETVFGEGETGTTTLLPDGPRGLFIARYKANGNVDWVRSVSTQGSYNRTVALTTRTDGSVAATGQIGSTTTFGEGEDNETNLEVDHISEGFLAVFGL